MEKQPKPFGKEDNEFFSPHLTKLQKYRKIFFLLLGFIAFNLFVWGTLYYTIVLQSGKNDGVTKNTENNFSDLNKIEAKTEESGVAPTPFPFQEMTIPYLSSREYRSSLGDLNQSVENSSYTGYLTSYDSDGFKINGFLTTPKGNMPDDGWPAIVFVHGYIPPNSYKTLENYSAYVDFLAKNEFVVFKIDLRGHAESEGEAGGSYYSGDYIIDTLNARAALKNSNFVNPEKIGLWGHSMAGNVVSRAMGADSQIPAVAIWAGAVYTYEDFSDFRIQDSSYQPPAQDSEVRNKREELFQIHGNFDKNSQFWKQVPVTNYLNNIKGAISIHHAVDDAVVSIEYSRNFKQLLDESGVENELIEYSNGGHNISGNSFNQAMQNTVDFFKKHLN